MGWMEVVMKRSICREGRCESVSRDGGKGEIAWGKVTIGETMPGLMSEGAVADRKVCKRLTGRSCSWSNPRGRVPVEGHQSSARALPESVMGPIEPWEDQIAVETAGPGGGRALVSARQCVVRRHSSPTDAVKAVRETITGQMEH